MSAHAGGAVAGIVHFGIGIFLGFSRLIASINFALQVRSHAVVGRTNSLPVKPTQQTSIVLPQQRMYIDYKLLISYL